MSKLLVFDCDSTLSGIEGIDALGRLRTAEIAAQIAQLTTDAMDGRVPLDDVFGLRLSLIQPSRQDCDRIAQCYLDHVEPHAKRTIAALKGEGWDMAILSGGFVPCIAPLAAYLGIDRLEAVPLYFDPSGAYAGYGADYPTTRNGGKLEVLRQLKAEGAYTQTVMVGDGVSDLETRPGVDCFIGFGAYVSRPRVRAQADEFIHGLDELPALLQKIHKRNIS
jgi:phosphoserine phosphatase